MLGKLRLTNQNKETAHSNDGRVPNLGPVPQFTLTEV